MEKTNEIHKPVKVNGEIIEDYYVTSTGKVWSDKTKRYFDLHGPHYYNILLRCNNKSRGVLIHRLVAEAFIPNPNNFPSVNHIDGNKKNNDVSNLEWCTSSWNAEHAYKIGLNKSCKKPVIQYSIEGKKIAEFNSVTEASKATDCSTRHISGACNGKARTSRGFRWEYNNGNNPKTLSIVHGACKKINQLDPVTHKIIEVHEDRVNAAEKIKCTIDQMQYACKTKGRILKGYLWEIVPLIPKNNKIVNLLDNLPDQGIIKIKGEITKNYYITKDSKIWSNYTKKYLKFSNGDYCKVGITHNNKRYTTFVHVLIAEAFIPNPNNFSVVNHIDGNKRNNNISNLEWCTSSWNSKHAYSTGLIIPHKRPVIQYTKTGEKIAEHISIKQATKELNIGKSSINAVCKNKQYTAGGFRWSYKGEELDLTKKRIKRDKKPKPPISQSDIISNNLAKLEQKTQIQNKILELAEKNRTFIQSPYRKSIVQYTPTGDKIAEFISITQASKTLNIDPRLICNVCKGRRNLAGGFIWKYQGEMPVPVNINKYKGVNQINPETKEIIVTHKNLKEAAASIGCYKGSVSSACLGRIKILKGFIWKYVF
jgi:hypothetical protein